jgi:ABC-type Fe3+-hydroxamate transport system substrate-binding protein
VGVDPVACTRFCEQPDLPVVGGTKTPDIDAIVRLAPDLVVMNDEENRLEDAEALGDTGLRVHSMSPRSVADVGPAVFALGQAVGADVPAVYSTPDWDGWLVEQGAGAANPRRRSTALVWRRPWMVTNADTYGSSLLELLGVHNVFADEKERYPEVVLDEIAARHADLVLLPDEPYPFKARHVEEVKAAVGEAAVHLVNGRDLFWWGVRTTAALSRLRDALRRW